MANTWILVSNAHRARCFEYDKNKLKFTELADFAYPQARIVREHDPLVQAGADRKGHGRSAHAGTQLEPRTSNIAKERSHFARQLAEFLNKGVATKSCGRLALIASDRMLGEIRPCLSSAADRALGSCVAGDYTRYQGHDLNQRLEQALHLSR